jgi:uncharacterized protein YjbI with pentapeptide repeats
MIRFAAIAFLGVLSARAEEPKFSYVRGECVDEAGRPGLNPGVFGDCGDLRGAKLDAKDLSGTSLRGADLRGASLRKTKLDGANLERADLGGAALVGASARSTTLTYARMEDANWDGATISDSTLVGARASRASFRDAILENDGFEGADLAQALFDRAKSTGCRFTNALLYETSFADAAFTGGSFRKTDLSFAGFERAKLPGVDFASASGVQPVFREAEGDQAVFAGALLSEADFSRSRFTKPDFSGAQLVDSSLEGASWTGAKIVQGLLRSTTLKGANLDGADFRASRFEDCRLETASFLGADFRMTSMQPGGWETAKLRGAKINARTRHPFSDAQIAKAGIVVIGRSGDAGILLDPRYVDTDAGPSAEGTNISQFLATELSYKTTNYDPTNLPVELDTVGTYVVPEFEHDVPPLGTGEIAAFQSFLSGGGNLVVFYNSSILIERILGKTLAQMSGDEFKLDAKVASGLGLELRAEKLVDLSATNSYRTDSLPAGTRVIYGDEAQGTAAFMIPYEKGRIWYLGWDFYNFPNRDESMNAWGALLKSIMNVSMSGDR